MLALVALRQPQGLLLLAELATHLELRSGVVHLALTALVDYAAVDARWMPVAASLRLRHVHASRLPLAHVLPPARRTTLPSRP